MRAQLAAELESHARALGRRDVLRLVGVAAAAGILPSGCGGLPDALTPPPGTKLQHLSPRRYAVLTAAAMRIVGPTGADLIRRRVVDAGGVADELLGRMPLAAGPVGTALMALEFGVPPIVWKLRPFTRLTPEAQDGVLDGLMRSRLDLGRQLFGAVRSLSLLAFYGSPESRVVSGYPGPFGSAAVSIADAMVSAAGTD